MADNDHANSATLSSIEECFTALRELQKQTSERPYSLLHRIRLAEAYKHLGYPDLAAGDAYKALLLVDEIVEDGEYHDEVLEAALEDRGRSNTKHEAKVNGEDETTNWAMRQSESIYVVLITSLIDCGCFRSAHNYSERAFKAFPGNPLFVVHRDALVQNLRSYFHISGDDFDAVVVQEYPDKGFVRRELYPWNEYEPDRFSADVLQYLNEEMAHIAPKLEANVVELPFLTESSSPGPDACYVKQLGVFAKEDIAPGELILQEKSLLTAVSRLHESYCDACSASLPHQEHAAAEANAVENIISCEECEDVFFCCRECHDLAQETYHPSLCGVSIEQKVTASEAADSLYTLLLVRAMALAETQGMHPLELKEVRYIWGDYHGLDFKQICELGTGAFGLIRRTLPFSFDANVLRPLHILEKMGVNIFEQSHRYDTWVFNTLYAKLRGTASARQGLDGRPEIGAVHPMWCLANHSCDPNVAWEWQGSMRFWTRNQLVDWKGRDPTKTPGLKKGEEVLGHYCDITLPVKERREWAVGALGGLCICARCVSEAAE